jgi:dCMP deaminase
MDTAAAGFLPDTSEPESQGIIVVPDHVDTWEDYFMWMASAASIKSKDPRCRVGAVIASKGNVILSTGFNGLARGVHDDEHLLTNADEKLKVICHAEQNAILNAARIGVALESSSIFVTKFPCLSCCNAIIQAGISRIYTHDKGFWDDDPFDKDHSRKKNILHQAGMQVDAPFHPAFMPKERIDPQKNRKKSVRGTDNSASLKLPLDLPTNSPPERSR